MSARSRHSVDPPILIVDAKDSLRTKLRHALEAQGHTVVEARDQREAEAALLASHPAVVLSDLRLTEGDGFGVLRAAKDSDPQLPVIVMTAFGSIQDAVAAMKEGALDFLAKPVDPDHPPPVGGRAPRARAAGPARPPPPAGRRKPAPARGAGAAPRRTADCRRRRQAEAGVGGAAPRGRHREGRAGAGGRGGSRVG